MIRQHCPICGGFLARHADAWACKRCGTNGDIAASAPEVSLPDGRRLPYAFVCRVVEGYYGVRLPSREDEQ